MSKGTEKKGSKKREPTKRKRDQVVSVLGAIKRGLMWTGSAIRRAVSFLGEGRNAIYAIGAYAIIIMIIVLGML